jgi:ribosomal protein S27AE
MRKTEDCSKTESKNLKAQLYEIRQEVLERDDYTCQKCGQVSASTYHRERMIKSTNRHAYNVDVYDYEHNAPLTATWQVESAIGSMPDTYITWCQECRRLEDVQHFKEIKFECPIHRYDTNAHYNNTDCWEKTFDIQVAMWFNERDLLNLRRLAHVDNKESRELLKEAINDLLDKHGVKFVDSCENCNGEKENLK